MAKKKAKPTEIVVVLDRSGSMNSIRDDSIGGFNTFIEEQAGVPGECFISLIQFDHEIDVVYEGRAAGDVPPLTTETYIPRGYTSLRDAIARGVALLEKRIAGKEGILPVLVILTDGFENASKEVSHERLMQILDKCATDKWGVIYLGANQDAISVGASMNVSVFTSSSFSPKRVAGALRSTSANLASYRGTGDLSDLSYSIEQRALMMGT